MVYGELGKSIQNRGLTSIVGGVFEEVQVAAWPAQTRGSSVHTVLNGCSASPKNLLHSTIRKVIYFPLNFIYEVQSTSNEL